MPLVAGKTPGRNRALEPDAGGRPSCSLFPSPGIIIHAFVFLFTMSLRFPTNAQKKKRKEVYRIKEEPTLSSSIAETLLLFWLVDLFLDFSRDVNSIYWRPNYCTTVVLCLSTGRYPSGVEGVDFRRHS